MYILKVYSIQYTLRQKASVKKIPFGQTKRYKKYPLFSFQSSNSPQFYFEFTILIWDEAQSLSQSFRFRFVFIKVCVFVQQNAFTLWLLNVIIPFIIKIIKKPHTVLLPDLWFLCSNKKFENWMLSAWVGAPQKLTWR